MKKKSLILLLFAAPVFSQAKDWVYMKQYPYIYDGFAKSWQFVMEPSLWIYDFSTEEWSEFGEPPPAYAPETLSGLTFTCCERSTCSEGNFSGYEFSSESEGESFLFDSLYGGLRPDYVWTVKYEYERIGENRAVISFAPAEQGRRVEVLILEFTADGEGSFTGTFFSNVGAESLMKGTREGGNLLTHRGSAGLPAEALKSGSSRIIVGAY